MPASRVSLGLNSLGSTFEHSAFDPKIFDPKWFGSPAPNEEAQHETGNKTEPLVTCASVTHSGRRVSHVSCHSNAKRRLASNRTPEDAWDESRLTFDFAIDSLDQSLRPRRTKSHSRKSTRPPSPINQPSAMAPGVRPSNRFAGPICRAWPVRPHPLAS